MASGPCGRRLVSKDLPTLRRLGQGHSGYLYETEWDGKRHARKDFPLGSVELNRIYETAVQPLFDLDHPNLVNCVGYSLGKSSCSLVQEYVEENLQNTIQSRKEERRKTSSRSTSTGTRVLDVDEIRNLVSSRGKKKEIAATDKGSLRCPTPTPFEWPEAIAIISQIATGMKYLHDNQVVHGDLKPRNVLVYSESGERRVKLADFGLCEIKEKITLVSERSRRVETLTWKAPECWEEEEVLGPLIVDLGEGIYTSELDSAVHNKSKAFAVEEVERIRTAYHFLSSKLAMADVYSFGATCIYILGGKLSYPDVSLTELRQRGMQGPRSKFPPECPRHLKLMIDLCLKLKPSSRPTFTVICAALQQYLTLQIKTTAGAGLQSAITEASLRDEVTEASLRDEVTEPSLRDEVTEASLLDEVTEASLRSVSKKSAKRFKRSHNSILSGVRCTQHKERPWSVEVRVEGEKWWLGAFNTPEAAGRAADAAYYYYDCPDKLNFRDSPQFLKPIPENLSGLRKISFVKEEARWLAELSEMLPSTCDPDNQTFRSPLPRPADHSVQYPDRDDYHPDPDDFYSFPVGFYLDPDYPDNRTFRSPLSRPADHSVQYPDDYGLWSWSDFLGGHKAS